MNKTKNLWIAFTFSMLSAAVIFIYGFFNSYLTCWDAVPYVAAQKMINGDEDFATIHFETYSLIASEYSGRGYEAVASGNDYALQCHSDPEALRQQMKFYTVKPGYNYFNILLSRFGMNELDTLFANTYLFSLLLYLMVFICLAKATSLIFSLYMTPVVFVLSGCFMLINTATTPDVMLAFFSVLALILVVQKKYYWGLFLLLLTVTIRSDNFLRYFLVVAVIAMIEPRMRKKTALAFSVGVLIYFLLAMVFPAYPWQTLFYHSHLGRLAYPEAASASVGLFDYLRRIATNTHYFFDVNMFLIFVPALLILWGREKAEIKNNTQLLLLVVSLTFIVIHYLLHPEVSVRYFLTDSIFVLMVAAMYLFKNAQFSVLQKRITQ